MKMKYTALFLAITCSIGSAFADGETRADGIVNISGEVVSQTCTVANGGNITVALPRVSTTTLDSAGKVAGMTQFPITLTGCAATTSNSENAKLNSIGIYFSGFNVTKGGALENIATANAAGKVNVQLLDKKENIINPNDSAADQVKYTESLNGLSSTNSLTLTYYARYIAAGQSTPGLVNATIPFVIVYK